MRPDHPHRAGRPPCMVGRTVRDRINYVRTCITMSGVRWRDWTGLDETSLRRLVDSDLQLNGRKAVLVFVHRLLSCRSASCLLRSDNCREKHGIGVKCHTCTYGQRAPCKQAPEGSDELGNTHKANEKCQWRREKLTETITLPWRKRERERESGRDNIQV